MDIYVSYKYVLSTFVRGLDMNLYTETINLLIEIWEGLSQSISEVVEPNMSSGIRY